MRARIRKDCEQVFMNKVSPLESGSPRRLSARFVNTMPEQDILRTLDIACDPTLTSCKQEADNNQLTTICQEKQKKPKTFEGVDQQTYKMAIKVDRIVDECCEDVMITCETDDLTEFCRKTNKVPKTSDQLPTSEIPAADRESQCCAYGVECVDSDEGTLEDRCLDQGSSGAKAESDRPRGLVSQEDFLKECCLEKDTTTTTTTCAKMDRASLTTTCQNAGKKVSESALSSTEEFDASSALTKCCESSSPTTTTCDAEAAGTSLRKVCASRGLAPRSPIPLESFPSSEVYDRCCEGSRTPMVPFRGGVLHPDPCPTDPCHTTPLTLQPIQLMSIAAPPQCGCCHTSVCNCCEDHHKSKESGFQPCPSLTKDQIDSIPASEAEVTCKAAGCEYYLSSDGKRLCVLPPPKALADTLMDIADVVQSLHNEMQTKRGSFDSDQRRIEDTFDEPDTQDAARAKRRDLSTKGNGDRND